MSFLLGVPGKLNAIKANIDTLLSRLSTTVVGRIDSSISSRAPSSTALSTAQWTNSRASLLDELSKVENVRVNPILAAPISFSTTANVFGLGTALSFTSLSNSSASVTTSFVTILSITGRGVLSFLAPVNNNGSAQQTFRVTVDGTVAYTGTLLSGSAGLGTVVIGTVAVDGGGNLSHLGLEQVAFNSSVVVEASSNSASSNVAKLYYKWRRSS